MRNLSAAPLIPSFSAIPCSVLASVARARINRNTCLLFPLAFFSSVLCPKSSGFGGDDFVSASHDPGKPDQPAIVLRVLVAILCLVLASVAPAVAGGTAYRARILGLQAAGQDKYRMTLLKVGDTLEPKEARPQRMVVHLRYALGARNPRFPELSSAGRSSGLV